MNELISHIEFLLHSHDCVIIPDLGGFVVNYSPVQRNGLSVFDAPCYEITFNQSLTHNDGLLAQSYMQTDGLSFQAATAKVEQAVRQMHQALQCDEKVELDVLGALRMNAEKHLVFTPGSFTRPDIFGFPVTKFKPMIQLQPSVSLQSKSEDKPKIIRRIAIGAAAAAVVAFMIFVFPVTDTPKLQQKAQLFTEIVLLSVKTSEPELIEMHQPAATVSSDEIEDQTPEIISPAETTEVQVVSEAVSEKRYYVVVGVYGVHKLANQILNNLKDGGFSLASSHTRAGRTDVYAASFTKRATAEAFQRELHANYPAYKDAWILRY